MPLYLAEGSPTTVLSDADICARLQSVLESLGPRERVCVIPPDFTRYHSKGGVLTQAVYRHYGEKVKDIMPALGTHAPVSDSQLHDMFGVPEVVPKTLFRVHDWRNDVVKVGEVPAEMVEAASGGGVSEPWPAQLNKLVWEGKHDLILSIGQVVPHEVLGMANHSKNLFVGVGGADAINFSHFIGACYGMERMMGRADTPLRKILNYACEHYLQELPVVYVLTVRGRDDQTGELVTRGLYIGTGLECYTEACKLSLEVNFQLLNEPITKAVVYLDPSEFHSTWLGNKAIYRTRMALADNAELIVLAPGVRTFGEDPRIDELIRKYGYRTTPEVMKFTRENRDLMKNLSAAAHLIHGTSENRFRIIYCPGHLTEQEIQSVGYEYGSLEVMSKRYDITKLKDGWNVDAATGERFFYVSNPATGLWAFRGRFDSSSASANAGESKSDSVSASAAEPAAKKLRTQ